MRHATVYRGVININRPKTIRGKQSKKLINNLSARDKILVELGIKSGLRISDLLNLKVEDIKRTMTIYETKSKRKRTFKIGKKLYANLKSLSVCKSDSDFIFHSEAKTGKHVHRSTIHRRIKKALQGLNFDCSAHSTRKLYAQKIYKKTGSVKKVQKAMNHQRITTTATYLDINVDKLIKGVKHGKRN